MTKDSFFYPAANEERYFENSPKFRKSGRTRSGIISICAWSTRAAGPQSVSFAHYELFKLTTELPGHYADFGVYYGNSFFTWHKLLEIFTPAATHKKVIGFDSFAGFPNLSEEDGALDERIQKEEGGFSSASFLEEFEALLSLHNGDSLIPANRGSIVKGDICETLPAWLRHASGARFCLINLDVDLYEPTKVILEQCWDRVVPGASSCSMSMRRRLGPARPWLGRFRKIPRITSRIHRFSYANAPGGYVIKGS